MRSSIIVALLGCLMHCGGVMAFGVESALPHLQDLHTHLPLVHQAATCAVSTHTIPSTGITDLSKSISSIQSTNHFLASSSLNAAANNGDGAMALSDMASSLFQDYRNALDAHPLRVKITTGCLLAIVGDAIAQSIQPEDYNKKRAAAFVAFDGVWRTVQQVTYGPIILNCNGKFFSGLLDSLPMASVHEEVLKEENRVILGAMEQTLVSQLLLIPCKFFVAVKGLFVLLFNQNFHTDQLFCSLLSQQQSFSCCHDLFISAVLSHILFCYWFCSESHDRADNCQSKRNICTVNETKPVVLDSGSIWGILLCGGKSS